MPDQSKLTVRIGDWKIVQTNTMMMQRCAIWVYHKEKFLSHATCKRMTEEELRAMLLSIIERAEHDNRDT